MMAGEISALSFEDALSELERIVATLDKGQATLEESIALYERGAQLKLHCEGKLKSAQAKIEKVVIAGGDAVGTTPLDVE